MTTPAAAAAPVRFHVTRLCRLGECPDSFLRCACGDVDRDVEVDELTTQELETFGREGTASERAEIADYLA